MYRCESWTTKKAEGQRIDAFELWCWRRLWKVPWTARRSNQSILKETDRNTIIIGYFNTPLTSMDRSSRQKINKATEILNDTVEDLDLVDIFKILHPKKVEYMSSAHGILSEINDMLLLLLSRSSRVRLCATP